MKNIVLLFLFLAYFNCSTIDFIPDGNYQENLLKSNKRNWNEIEILASRPVKPFTIYGTIFIRDYSVDLDFHESKFLKKELYSLGFDGIWLTSQKNTPVPPTVIETSNHQGVVVSVYEANREISITKGYPFRYK